ncbi:MAG: TniB family NTP-binding protein [Spongiibacteraceae bacterium]
MNKGHTQHFQDMSEASIPQRIDYLRSGVFLDTSVQRDLREYLNLLVREPKDADRKLVFLTAPPGMGLSRLLGDFVAQNPPFTEQKTGRPVVPVVNEEIQPSGDIIDYCDEMRVSLAIPGFGPTVRIMSLRRTLTLLDQIQTRLVILEDFHRTYSFKKHQMVAYQNFVHHLISKYNIRVVVTGAPRIWRWAMEDEQTLGRSVHLQYRAWTPHDDDFIEFLEAFERWCPNKDGGTLSHDPKFRKSLITKTHGICREVMQTLTSLAIFAIVSGSERLDFETWMRFRDQDLPS